VPRAEATRAFQRTGVTFAQRGEAAPGWNSLTRVAGLPAGKFRGSDKSPKTTASQFRAWFARPASPQRFTAPPDSDPSASAPDHRREVSSVTISAADCGFLARATLCPAHIESASISPVVPAIGGAGS
jgi:hypothetical protein